MIKELNIKCKNNSEAKFIEKYFLNMGCIWDDDDQIFYFEGKYNYPIIIYNVIDNKAYDTLFYFTEHDDFNYDRNEVIEAKYFMREEKLKRLWKK